MSKSTFAIYWPKIKKPERGILPVFIPYAGCPRKCVFCAQDKQSGVKEDSIFNHLERLDAILAERVTSGLRPVELAFYGGTFTALPSAAFYACLALVEKYRRLGMVASARCSTRPDAVDLELLAHMKDGGFNMVELGVQSFDDQALLASGRGYIGAKVDIACALVHEAGLELGIQLMPGLPGGGKEIFAADVARALSLKPKILRFYPCLVLAGSGLADLYQAGRFKPWSMDLCLEALALGWLEARKQNVAVIRMGLAPEPGLEQHIVAGPHHAELGARVMARALFMAVSEVVAAQGKTIVNLRVPAWCQGFFAGHGGEMSKLWAELGLKRSAVSWHGNDTVEFDCQ